MKLNDAAYNLAYKNKIINLQVTIHWLILEQLGPLGRVLRRLAPEAAPGHLLLLVPLRRHLRCLPDGTFEYYFNILTWNIIFSEFPRIW